VPKKPAKPAGKAEKRIDETLLGGQKMKKKVRVRVAANGHTGFFKRAREHARRLDRGLELAPEITVSFEDPADMMRVLSTQRVRLLRAARQKPSPVSDLAIRLQRDVRAVSRDVELLEHFGLLRSRYEKNPGHGRRRIVEPRAASYQLVAAI
jgi:predicted transcriptional regulator